jgi:protein TonB
MIGAGLVLVAVMAAAPADEPVPQVAPPMMSPQPATAIPGTNMVFPSDYPIESRVAGESGVVRLGIVISINGLVQSCEIVESSGYPRLDAAGCHVIMSRWRYRPASRDGRPVAERRIVPIRWSVAQPAAASVPAPSK